MIRSMTEVFDILSSIKSVDERKYALKQAVEQLPSVGMMLQLAYDTNFKLDLPEGDIPYKATLAIGQESRLHQEMKKMYMFFKAYPLNQERKAHLFVQMLESLDPKDATLMVQVKQGKFPYTTTVTRKMVDELFPTILRDKKANEQK